MKLWKNSERKIHTHSMINTYKTVGATVKNLGRWKKWKDLRDGGRLAVKMDVYECEFNGTTFYFLSDTLERVAAPNEIDKQVVMGWLKDKGYKPEKQWYMEDYGMTEETWEEWNNA